jgi:hypothetical protein
VTANPPPTITGGHEGVDHEPEPGEGGAERRSRLDAVTPGLAGLAAGALIAVVGRDAALLPPLVWAAAAAGVVLVGAALSASRLPRAGGTPPAGEGRAWRRRHRAAMPPGPPPTLTRAERRMRHRP